jgi:squalene-associated FAD-dependent desaturase
MVNTPHINSKRIAIIGGGWSGCAAALTLTQLGYQIDLFESTHTLGGRARTVLHHEQTFDNGQHILSGAYHHTFNLVKFLKINLDDYFLNLPLQLHYPNNQHAIQLHAKNIAAPWNIVLAFLGAQGFTLKEKFSLLYFAYTINKMNWKLSTNCTVQALLIHLKQSDRIISLLWEPLCVATLNTPIQRACAQTFLNILHDCFNTDTKASQFFIPREHLTQIFPAHVQNFLEQHHNLIYYGHTIKKIIPHHQQWQLISSKADQLPLYDALIIATPPIMAASLLNNAIPSFNPPKLAQQTYEQLLQLEYEPITTCYLQYATSITLPHPYMALRENALEKQWGQFVFDQGQLNPKYKGRFAIVISSSHAAAELTHEELSHCLAQQLAQAFNQIELATPLSSFVITEKRATFSCTPHMQRPSNQTGISNLFLAGDYTVARYPATLESAIQSGIHAAYLVTHS